jgi:L-threonylcarbamoyladenylate synthase
VRVARVNPTEPDPGVLRDAAQVLRDGGLVAIPTETVYGLAADATNSAAIRRLFALKGRPGDNPLIVHVADLDSGDRLAGVVTPLARRLAACFWPGPLTLVVPARPGVAAEVTAGLDTVGLRCPAHPVAAALLAEAGLALAAPSANRSGRPSPTTAAHVVTDFAEAEGAQVGAAGTAAPSDLDLVLDAGPCGIGLESTVVDARGEVPLILRDGAVSREALGITAADVGERHRSPGTRHRHYAPACAVEIVPADAVAARAARLTAHGSRVAAVLPRGVDAGPAELVVAFADVAELARELFGALRAADASAYEVLLVAEVPEEGLGRAVMDRLRRAAGQVG